MRNLIQDTMQDQEDAEGIVSGPSKGKGKGKVPAGRDDDTHYFDSYAENGTWACAIRYERVSLTREPKWT